MHPYRDRQHGSMETNRRRSLVEAKEQSFSPEERERERRAKAEMR